MTKDKNSGELAVASKMDNLTIKEAGRYGKKTWYHPKYFQAHNDTIMYINYVEDKASKNEKHIGRNRFIKHKPFFVLCGTDSDKDICVCLPCYNMHGCRHACELLLKIETTNMDDFLDKIADIKTKITTTKNRTKLFLTQFEPAVICGRKTVITKTRQITGQNLVEKLTQFHGAYLVHHDRLNAERANLPGIKAEVLKSDSSMYIVRDYSENIPVMSYEESQPAHFKRQSFTLHVSVVYWKDQHFTVLHGGDFSAHGPELVGLAVIDAKKLVEDRFAAKIEKIVLQNDNCSPGLKFVFF